MQIKIDIESAKRAAPYFILIIVAIVCIVLGVIVARNAAKVSTPTTVKNSVRDRIAILNNQIEPLSGTKKSIYNTPPLPEDQRLLLNYSVQGCRLAGYLGPLQDGTFAEEDAVRLALASGCRLFTIEINKGPSGRPVLVASDKSGYKRSLNEGSIKNVCDALAKGIKGDDPLIISLYFIDAPNKTKDPGGYLTFLSHVAKALSPLIPSHLGLTSAGDFTRQKKEAELFTFMPEFYKNKVIILCNVDTSSFRNPSLVGVNKTFQPNEDLDFFVHCRLYKMDAGGELGLTTVPTGTVSAKALICDDSYFLLTPPDKIDSVINMTRNTFTIVMKKDPTYIPSKEVVARLFHSFGVNSVPIQLGGAESVDFKNAMYVAKDIALRFTKPSPIVPTVPNPALNANGGTIVAPKL